MVYQKISIQSSFLRERNFLQLLFTFQVQEMLSQKVINFNIIGHFQKSKCLGQHITLKPQTSFDQFLIMILKAWLKKSQDAKVSTFGQLKK